MADIRTAALLTVKEARDFLAALSEGAAAKKPLPVFSTGLSGEACELLLCEGVRQLHEEGKPILVLAPDEKTARRLHLRLSYLSAHLFSEREMVYYNITASHEIERERLASLGYLLTDTSPILITTPHAALSYTAPRDVLRERMLTLAAGDICTPERLCALLSASGYVSVPTVEGAGQFAHRGGIVDFCASREEGPCRIEFFDNEIDRINRFDPMSQRITDTLAFASILPAREVIPDAAAREKLRRLIEGARKGASGALFDTYNAELSAIDGEGELPFADKYLPLIYPEKETLLSYFEGKEPCVFVLNRQDTLAKLEAAASLCLESEAALIEKNTLQGGFASHADKAGIEALFDKHFTVYCNTFGGPVPGMRLLGLFGFSCRRVISYDGKEDLLTSDLAAYRDGGYRVILSCRSEAEVGEKAEELRKEGFSVITAGKEELLPEKGQILLCAEGCGEGFELPNSRLALLTLVPDGTPLRARRRRARFSGKKNGVGDRVLSYLELNEGDYVVHAMHGIGRFLGMQTLTVGGVSADYITLQYAGEEKLFLRADKLDMVSRYIGERGSDGTVRLHKIGGGEWGRAKARAKAAARDMAKELIALYAEREAKEGYAFPPDSDMERAFAASFEYEETEPQRVAIEEIKADMMRPRPMDRLLCGDVGFGKTEVALRACFKAVVGGKQAAILVPTTILALQHYGTLLSRMRGYPVNIEMLSRFRKPKERDKILRRLARGEIDIIVGTHSLLSKEVAFRDLGLLVVDEEQRFGVGQKEKIKQMAASVDVLTLTATPIPRTLNMAMNGIRDMSILDEAPEDRSPVQTFVMEHDDTLVAEALRRELSRGGQVLYLYNKIETIYHVADKLQRALPSARIAVAHGQMDKEEIEEIWHSLLIGEVDILVCTTIIETGVDLPNANTLIIENADRMGLSQLHQLRGRVGRSTRQAYAYCTYRPGKALTEIADKRLSAIREYAEFGAGFRIALRDLEIRGAGNLLGAEQHGHIDSVGYELYVRLLSEAVLEEKGTPKEVPFEATVDLSLDAYIPESYIASSAHRIDMYKKLSLIATEEDREDVLDEFCDRFGEPPKQVLNLLLIALSRSLASSARIKRVERRGGELRFSFDTLCLGAWSEAFAAFPGLRMCSGGSTPYVSYRLKAGEDAAKTAASILSAYIP